MGKLKCAFLAIAIGLFARDFCRSPSSRVTWYSNTDLGFSVDLNESGFLTISLLHPLTKRVHHNHTVGLGIDGIDSSVRKPHVSGGLDKREVNGLRVEWPGKAKLAVTVSSGDQVTCYNVVWYSFAENVKPTDCFSLEEGHWYGGAEVFQQRWPMDDQRSRMQPYTTGDYLSPRWRERQEYGKYGSILEPYWITSTGLGIHVNENVSLHSSFNSDGDGQLCLRSDRKGYFGHDDDDDDHGWLSYTVCQGESLFQVHRFMSDRFIRRPKAMPDERMIKAPIWSTWARYKVHVKQASVMEYAKEIKRYAFPNSQLEIDDAYSTQYGDFDFNAVKFPNATKMISQLHALGFRVTTWVTPFANIQSRAFLEGAESSYWLKTNLPHCVPSLTRWWQGTAGVLDVANDDAVKWYTNRLKKFQRQYGIDSFKFDAGELDFLPRDIALPPRVVNANHLTDLYVRLTEQFGGMVEVRSGYRSQDLPLFFRMLDKDSVWGYDNGLRSLIPTALFMSIIGYPFILPDMIGGNGYEGSEPLKTTSLPDRELYIRWLEVSAFLVSMQFSIAPWQYDGDVVKIAGKFMELREKFIVPEIIKAADNALKTGEPIIRPLWWIDQSVESLTSDTQFLIGDSILVAPVLNKGIRSRDVYLPRKGYQWKDHATQELFQGGDWVKAVDAPLDHVPVFIRVP